ncbi:ABC transporter permease [Jeotgalibacillus sp. R-1-5s-1]|uniref:ABC transporter permease n=1 Tax=Jeotgalibacillus sp. R-1-5s-1 TaxID=2555897 RepID=UPI00106C553B|nr:ABC transporter permease [Jeotgalibacillus sp. R-1-5s-1]TFE01344.1 ABC transporter permease [Jeotgalibacillus sp. R-1-5s-1]
MLLNIFKKEMKDSFRDRRTLLLTVILPIVMMTGLVLFYENLVSDGSDETYTLAVDQSIPTEVTSGLEQMGNIELITSDSPEEMVREGEALAALSFDETFTTRVENGEPAEAVLTGDSFSQNASILMNMVTTVLTQYEQVIVAERLEAAGTDLSMIEPFVINQQELSQENTNVNLIAMLIPLILSIAIGVGASPSAADLFAGEKERKTMEALLMTPVNRMNLLTAKWLTIASIGTITGIITLAVVILEIFLLTENLKGALSLSDNAVPVIAAALLTTVMFAMFTATLLMIASIAGKTVKEAQSYATPVTMISIFPLMIITGIGVNELTNTHFMIPVLNIFTILKELSFGIVDVQHILLMAGSNLLCVVIAFVVGRVMFLKDKWVMS